MEYIFNPAFITIETSDECRIFDTHSKLHFFQSMCLGTQAMNYYSITH